MFRRWHGHHERLLVLRSAPGLAAVALAAEVGVVDLHETRELARFLAFGHHLHDLVLELPRGVIAHAKVPLQFQRGHIGLAAGQQMHGQEPRGQRQLATFKHRPAGQRRLMATGTTLVVDPARAAKPRAWPAIASRATKSPRPACPVQRSVALRFGAVAQDELRHRQPRLELHLGHGHDDSPPRNMVLRLRRTRLTSRDGRLSVVANQVTVRLIYFRMGQGVRAKDMSLKNVFFYTRGLVKFAFLVVFFVVLAMIGYVVIAVTFLGVGLHALK